MRAIGLDVIAKKICKDLMLVPGYANGPGYDCPVRTSFGARRRGSFSSILLKNKSENKKLHPEIYMYLYSLSTHIVT